MNVLNIDPNYKEAIQQALPNCLTQTSLSLGQKQEGKVRDAYDLGNKLLIVTTDRQSAFDRHIANVPYKGQVLNLMSAWWFENTKHLVNNHLLSVPHPNASLVKKGNVFSIEFIVRGYITGTTNTSLWTQYKQGIRNYCGNSLPEGLSKNQRLAMPMLTPTTKDKVHDRPISSEDIIKEQWMSEKDWMVVKEKALSLYEHGSKIAEERGLILVDTKYEFAKDDKGNIFCVDELHTPDSSRYWLKETYNKRFENGLEPDNFDKEFIRLWFREHCDPYHDKVLPEAPEDLIVNLSYRYIKLYEQITGKTFAFTNNTKDLNRIDNIDKLTTTDNYK